MTLTTAAGVSMEEPQAVADTDSAPNTRISNNFVIEILIFSHRVNVFPHIGPPLAAVTSKGLHSVNARDVLGARLSFCFLVGVKASSHEIENAQPGPACATFRSTGSSPATVLGSSTALFAAGGGLRQARAPPHVPGCVRRGCSV